MIMATVRKREDRVSVAASTKADSYPSEFATTKWSHKIVTLVPHTPYMIESDEKDLAATNK